MIEGTRFTTNLEVMFAGKLFDRKLERTIGSGHDSHGSLAVDTRIKEVMNWMCRGLGGMTGCMEEKDDLNTSPTSGAQKGIISEMV